LTGLLVVGLEPVLSHGFERVMLFGRVAECQGPPRRQLWSGLLLSKRTNLVPLLSADGLAFLG
jgi:hypothetical protein